MFTENQHLVEVLPIKKVLFQYIKKGNFYTHYFTGVSAYVVISRLSFGNRLFGADISQLKFTCSKSTTGALVKGMNYVQS